MSMHNSYADFDLLNQALKQQNVQTRLKFWWLNTSSHMKTVRLFFAPSGRWKGAEFHLSTGAAEPQSASYKTYNVYNDSICIKLSSHSVHADTRLT